MHVVAELVVLGHQQFEDQLGTSGPTLAYRQYLQPATVSLHTASGSEAAAAANAASLDAPKTRRNRVCPERTRRWSQLIRLHAPVYKYLAHAVSIYRPSRFQIPDFRFLEWEIRSNPIEIQDPRSRSDQIMYRVGVLGEWEYKPSIYLSVLSAKCEVLSATASPINPSMYVCMYVSTIIYSLSKSRRYSQSQVRK